MIIMSSHEKCSGRVLKSVSKILMSYEQTDNKEASWSRAPISCLKYRNPRNLPQGLINQADPHWIPRHECLKVSRWRCVGLPLLCSLPNDYPFISISNIGDTQKHLWLIDSTSHLRWYYQTEYFYLARDTDERLTAKFMVGVGAHQGVSFGARWCMNK